jgi:hypothetical protein
MSAALELTPPGAGGVSVLALAGEASLAALGLPSVGPGAVRLVRPRLEGEVLDEALLVGRSHDRWELHLHGSAPLVRRVLRAAGAAGDAGVPRAAGHAGGCVVSAGLEARAEQLLPGAPTLDGARVLLAAAEGALRRRLEELLAGPDPRPEAAALVAAWDWQRWLQRVPRVVLRGPVNAGKSTLFNLLVGAEQALTAEEEGTTRDALVATGRMGPWAIEWVDTAGERQAPEGSVEASGQRLAERLAREADLVLRLDPRAEVQECVQVEEGVVPARMAGAGRPGTAGPEEHRPHAQPMERVLPARGDWTGAPGALAPLEEPVAARALVARTLEGALGLPSEPGDELRACRHAAPFAAEQVAAVAALARGNAAPLRALLAGGD